MNNEDDIMNDQSQHVEDRQEQQACPGKCTHRQIIQREALLKAKNSLIDNMIYHIRTLSNAVIGFSDLLSDETLEEDAASYVREIHNAGLGLSVLVNEMLDWTQLLAGKLKIARTKFPVFDVLREVQKILAWAATQKGLAYDIVIDPEMPAYLNTDPDRLLKCLVNLTASAIKHTPQGSVRIHVKPEDRNGELLIRFDVIDTGVGIAPEKLATVFDATEYRIEMDEEILSQLEQGLTVTTGLPLTRQLCQLLGGTLNAESGVNEGSTFSMWVPAGVDPNCEPKLGDFGRQEAACSPTHEEPEETATNATESGTVLLVEDQPSNRTVITLMLEALGVAVETAEDGLVALRHCEQNHYDLILMDLKMPNLDGYETTRRLRQTGCAAPIVALSATVMNEQDHRHISELFNAFLTKPVNSGKLASTLERFLPGFSGNGSCSGADKVQKNRAFVTVTDQDNRDS